MSDAQTAAQFLGALLLVEVMKWLVARFMKKAVGTQYMTVTACESSRTLCGGKRDQAHEELVGLITKATAETRRIRVLIVKYMVRSGAAVEEIGEALGEG